MGADFLIDGPLDAPVTVLLAHGAGAAMDTPVMGQIADGLAQRGTCVARFEFAYMAARRIGGPRRPPPRMPALMEEYRSAITALREMRPDGALVIGGKSMGGRVASLIAQDLSQPDRADAHAPAPSPVQGLLCFGYPFHPRGKPDSLRTEHLYDLTLPTLICQGTRDPLGTAQEVAEYALPDRIAFTWVEDGDHDLKPRKRVTGCDHAAALAACCAAATPWLQAL